MDAVLAQQRWAASSSHIGEITIANEVVRHAVMQRLEQWHANTTGLALCLTRRQPDPHVNECANTVRTP